MCDYSLHAVASRPANVGDRLVTTEFPGTVTRGLAAVAERNVAVCLLPGTEVAFDREVKYAHPLGWFWTRSTNERMARFRQLKTAIEHRHHDAFEFPSGKLVMVTNLVEHQTLTVLQLPVGAHGASPRGDVRQADRVHTVKVEAGNPAPRA
jgi:hypothetical protein